MTKDTKNSSRKDRITSLVFVDGQIYSLHHVTLAFIEGNKNRKCKREYDKLRRYKKTEPIAYRRYIKFLQGMAIELTGSCELKGLKRNRRV